MQQPTETQVLAGNSWTSLLASIQASQQANKALGNVSNSVSNKNLSTGVVIRKEEIYRRLVEVTKLKSHALTKDLAAKWQRFVTGIATNSSGNDQERFYGMLTVLLEAKLFDTWLHKFFAVAYDSNPNCLSTLLQTFNASKPFFEEMIQRLKTLESLDLKAIASPKAFKSVWESFYNDQVVYFTRPYVLVSSYYYVTKGFLNDLRDGSELQKLACLVLMEKFITVFDGAIKMVEESGEFVVSTAADIQLDKNFLVGSFGSYGSPSVAKQWDDSIETFWASPAGGKPVTATIGEGNKIFAVKVLLFFYLNTLRNWWSELGSNTTSSYSALTASGRRALVTSIARYDDCQVTEAFLSVETSFFGQSGSIGLPSLFSTNNEDSIKPTASFNVAEATMGSKANFGRACPKSLEDLFTFTHQSMLAVLAALYKNYGLAIDNRIPSLVIEAQRQVLACSSNQTSALPSLQGINFSNGTLELVYNWPQRLHSSTITASYLAKKIAGTAGKNRVLHLSINMFGADHYGRWSRIADYIQLKSRIDRLPLYSTLLKEKGIEFIWEIRESAANYSAVITSVINCMKIVSKIAGNFNIVTGDYKEMSGYLSPKLDFNERVNAQDGRKNLIAMSAEEERIVWGLAEVLSEPGYGALAQYFLQELDYSPELVKNMLTIATKLSDETSEYYAKSIILLHKLRYAPDLGVYGSGVLPANYYGLTKDTYVRKIASADLTLYRGFIATMISFILRKIVSAGALRYAADAGVQKACGEFVERGLPFLLDDTAYQTAGVALLTAIMQKGSPQFKAIIQPIVAAWETSNPTVYDVVRDIDGIEPVESEFVAMAVDNTIADVEPIRSIAVEELVKKLATKRYLASTAPGDKIKAAVILAKKAELLVQAGAVNLVSLNQLLTPIVGMLEMFPQLIRMPIPLQESLRNVISSVDVLRAENLRELIKPLLLSLYQQAMVKDVLKTSIIQFASYWDRSSNNDKMYHYFRKAGVWENYVVFAESIIEKNAYDDVAAFKKSIVVTKLQVLTYFGDLQAQAAGLLSRIEAL